MVRPALLGSSWGLEDDVPACPALRSYPEVSPEACSARLRRGEFHRRPVPSVSITDAAFTMLTSYSIGGVDPLLILLSLGTRCTRTECNMHRLRMSTRIASMRTIMWCLPGSEPAPRPIRGKQPSGAWSGRSQDGAGGPFSMDRVKTGSSCPRRREHPAGTRTHHPLRLIAHRVNVRGVAVLAGHEVPVEREVLLRWCYTRLPYWMLVFDPGCVWCANCKRERSSVAACKERPLVRLGELCGVVLQW